MKLSAIQKKVYEAMTPGVWYDYSDLPRATGHTYQALERKGLIESKQVVSYYPFMTPMIWTHEFMRLPKTEAPTPPRPPHPTVSR